MKSNKANWIEMISIYDHSNGYTLKYTKKRSDYTLEKKSIPGGYFKARLRSMKGEKVGLAQFPLAQLTRPRISLLN
ncbi:hypothetical protein SAMN05421877_102370 [Sphingobacterium lactis]|uniref:Uncharacterized protein n=2 Tax=Sphingobacterium lactis TaxID=797291 RepID=A0A1H5UPY1_9SPHI|nr:hypothetical protein SAMN05421877_102370 [Sphingobacterium lactis]